MCFPFSGSTALFLSYKSTFSLKILKNIQKMMFVVDYK